jgi:flagellar biogenesis protein FliO
MAYKFSRMLALHMAGKSGHRSYMKEVDRLVIGSEEYISIVQAADNYYMIGVTKQNINLLSEIDGETLHEIDPDNSDSASQLFEKSEFFKQLSEKIKKKENDSDSSFIQKDVDHD